MGEKQENSEALPGYSSIDDYTKDGFKVLVEATKSSNNLPLERDWDFYKVYDSFNKITNTESDRLLRLMNNILHAQKFEVNIRNKDLDEKTELIVEANDDILERIDNGIDEMNGVKKTAKEAVEIQTVSARLPVSGSWNQLNKAKYSVSSSISDTAKNEDNSYKSIRLLTAKNIVRPQSFFKDKIDNRSVPWIPRITEKPNSLKPLAISLEPTQRGEEYEHPYEFELERFTPSPSQLTIVTPIFPKLLEVTPLFEVSTPEQLEEMVEELRKYSEIAVDLEHHSYRTFMGITCLMQISTENADYLIDTLSLRDKLCILNEIFAKAAIVKVFHGAGSDIEWLQRDLSLYVVNMFDTHEAAKKLKFSRLNLATLMNTYCNVNPNKHFQLADWRIRPLPEELKTYARMDTHYLLYIYHMMRNELIKKANGKDNILRSVIDESTEICKKRYYKPLLQENSHLDFYRKCKRQFDNRQMYALKELYRWRDQLARNEDESTGYVLPNHMLLQIAELLPREMQGILACCNPIPPLVRSNLLELHRIILKAREQSVVKPILKEDNRSRGSTLQFNKLNLNNPLHCPHDLTKQLEFRDDLPTLLGNLWDEAELKEEDDKECFLEKNNSLYSIFNTPEHSNDGEDTLKLQNTITFLAPYERYKLMKPFIRAEEEAAEKTATLDGKPLEQENEDRIAALHEHFLNVTKVKPHKLPEAIVETQVSISVETDGQTLVAMGGSKKRKQREFDAENYSEFHSQYEIPENEIVTPLPLRYKRVRDFRPKKNKNNRKRTYGEALGNADNPAESISHEPHLNKKQKQNNKQKFRQKQKKNRQQNQHLQQDQNSKQIQHVQNPQQNQQPQQIDTQHDSQANNQNTQRNKNINPARKNYRNRNKMTNTQRKRYEWFQKNAQRRLAQQQDFQPFDYSSVNFNEFQGGAQGPSNRGGVKSHFKGKNKKKFNKNANKSITFGRNN